MSQSFIECPLAERQLPADVHASFHKVPKLPLSSKKKNNAFAQSDSNSLLKGGSANQTNWKDDATSWMQKILPPFIMMSKVTEKSAHF